MSLNKMFTEICHKMNEQWQKEDNLRAPFMTFETISSNPRLYTDYTNHIAVGNDVYSIKSGFINTPRLVRIDSTGKEHFVSHFSPNSSCPQWSDYFKRIYWSEDIPDERWSMKTDGKIRYIEEGASRKKTLRHKGNLHNPTPVSDDSYISATEYRVDGRSMIDIVGGHNGKVIKTLHSPDSLQIVETAWLGKTLYATAVSENGFRGQNSLSHILLPDSIRIVGDGAFENCDHLYKFTLGQDLTTIGARAFAGCALLEELKLPEGVSVIGEEAFRGCSSLTALTIPAGVTRIESNTFRDCTALTKILLPQDITFVGARAFAGCQKLSELKLPDKITVLEEYALENCNSLTSLHIPTGITVLSEGVLFGCASIKKITLHEGITTISSRVFEGCFLLNTVTIPQSVSDMGEHVFDGCSNLATLGYSGTLEKWETVNKPNDWPSTMLFISCADGKINLSA